ncbi:MAG: FtsW/RodA/SpoVE family cell cycle protein [Planctomycetes bacterium]|nr:FtsW/RodA/SpoVE family cell cycle protein [Planctomycetota bacterium]
MSRPIHALTQPGWLVLVSMVVLVTLGTASIYVTDTHYVRGHDGPVNAAKQVVHVVVGLALASLVLRIGYQRIARYGYALFGLAVLALVPLLLAKMLGTTFGGMVEPRNGAFRWIQLPGFQVQPSEFVKLTYVIALAAYLRYRRNYRRFGGLLLPFLISIFPLALILAEPDLGTVLLLIPLLFALLFTAGAKILHLGIIALIAVAMAPLAWGQIKGYQRLRVTAVLLQSERLRQAVIHDPETYAALATKRQALEWAAGSGYQLVHSKNAIGSGGLWGQGWGQGAYVTHSLLPDRHNDFVFSLIGHQWGLLGCVVVLACYSVIVVAGMRIASVTTDPFGRLLAIGIITLIATQVLINVGMTLGLMPITGITLPFVSYGGSSMLSSLLSISLLISVSQHRPFLLATKPFDFVKQRDQLPVPPAVARATTRNDAPAARSTLN